MLLLIVFVRFVVLFSPAGGESLSLLAGGLEGSLNWKPAHCADGGVEWKRCLTE